MCWERDRLRARENEKGKKKCFKKKGDMFFYECGYDVVAGACACVPVCFSKLLLHFSSIISAFFVRIHPRVVILR